MGRDLPHADGHDGGDVYGPAEDSALLAEAAVDRLDPADRVLDVGTGSGFVARRVREAVGATVVASDRNPAACRAAADEGLPVVRADLVTPFADGSLDAVTFNPPYLPTPAAMERDDWMERALSGGESGRAVIEPFLETVPRVLSPHGRVLLVASSLTDLEAVADLARTSGFAVERVTEESFPFEVIAVLECTLGEAEVGTDEYNAEE